MHIMYISSNSAAPGRQDLAKYNTRPTVFVKAQTHDHNNNNERITILCSFETGRCYAIAVFLNTHMQTHIVTI